MNTSEMVTILRDFVGEASAAHWSDLNLLRRLNMAQRRIALWTMEAAGDWLVQSVAVTPVAGVITLPARCAKPVALEETSSGNPIVIRGTVRERKVGRQVGLTSFNPLEAYFQAGKLVVNQDSYTEPCTLWYQERIPDLLTGTGDTGSTANALVFAAAVAPVMIDDYYNDVDVEIVSGTGIGTIAEITDFVASTRTATVSGTFSTDSVYGTISRLPEEAHHLLVYEAALVALSKPGSTIDEKVFSFLSSLYGQARKDLESWLSKSTSANEHVRVTEIL